MSESVASLVGIDELAEKHLLSQWLVLGRCNTVLEGTIEPSGDAGSLKLSVVRRIGAGQDDVLQCLTDLFIEHGPPEDIRSDNGPEFAARAVRHWLGRLGVKTLFIEPGSPWENGYCESFNSKLRDELLNAEMFSTLYEAEVLIESWRRHYNAVWPHSSLGYRPPAPEAILPRARGLPYRLRGSRKMVLYFSAVIVDLGRCNRPYATRRHVSTWKRPTERQCCLIRSVYGGGDRSASDPGFVAKTLFCERVNRNRWMGARIVFI